MSMNKIDLAGHPNPEDFFHEIEKKYKDKKVSFALLRDKLLISTDKSIPLQLEIDIVSFINERVKEEIYQNRF